ncbi:alanine racemase [Methylorubrum salsuginis]|uniref:Alanine racemase n=1 Tax=Methylorubrum salsuginis TaxID=414703 RepID=A0A1I4HSG2_9HYPH|nr:alanine racemase [Methylorubrum salsuginis]SFL45169.1 alanine racemase [Methylorubrum salsuginis]
MNDPAPPTPRISKEPDIAPQDTAPQDSAHDAIRAGHGARLTVDLAALVANWRALGAQAPQAECGAVVKADAYGCGLSRVAPALARAGCRSFFVAHLSEGIAARRLLPEAAIYVLNGLPPGAGAVFAAHGLRPVLGDRDELAEWAALSDGRRPAALHVDTGMNRLGLSVPAALGLAGDPVVEKAGIDLVMSHLVSAELPADPLNARQAADFSRVRAAFPNARASLANSSGTWLADATRHDLLRPGYSLFGGNPEPGKPNPMRPVVRLEATILQIRTVEAGATCGYNARWTAPGPRRLATLSLGYADGYPRAASGRGHALVGGVSCPILGLISMDLIILDVTDAPAARRGGTATLIGDGLDIDTVGQAAGTIGYEILTGLGSRYVRHHVE